MPIQMFTVDSLALWFHLQMPWRDLLPVTQLSKQKAPLLSVTGL